MSGMRDSRIDGGDDRHEWRAEALEAEVAEWKRNFDFAVKHHHGRTLAAEAECARLRVRLEAATELLRERRSEDFDFFGTWDDRTRAFLAAEDS